MARFLAIDWDQGLLHVLAADVRAGGVNVRQVAVWPETQAPNPATAEDLGKALRERLKSAGIAPAPLLACIGRDRLIVKEVRFPAVPDGEEPAVVRFQAVKELTDPPDEVVIDYVVTGPGPAGIDRKAAALVVRREMVEAYRKLAEAAGLKLMALTPRFMGTAACLRNVMGKTVVTPPPSPPDGVVCTILVGEKFAEISMLHGDVFLLARSMPVGPNLAGEIRRNLAVHAGQMPQAPLAAVYVAGQGSGELRHRLGELIEVPVHTFDPFALVETIDLKEVGSNRGTFAGAMGLLVHKSQGELPVNFVSPRQPKPQANPNYRLIRLAAVAAIVLFVGLGVLGRVLHAAWATELSEIEVETEKRDKELLAARENAKRLKAIDDWDNLVWLDELYDLNARIPDVNALRVTSFSVEPLTRNPKSKVVARATIKGKLLSKSNPRKPLDQLVSQMGKEGYYSVEAPKVENDVFTLVVNVERRAPGDYKHVLKEVSKAIRSSSEDTSTSEADTIAEEKPESKSKGKGKTKGKSKRPPSD